MLLVKGIVTVDKYGLADTSELQESLSSLGEGEFGYILFDKQKNRSLPQLKYLYGYILKTLSEELPGKPNPEALYRFFEERYAPVRTARIPGEGSYDYFDLKSENAAEMDKVITAIIRHAKEHWGIDLMSRKEITRPSAAEPYAGAYAATWKNHLRTL